MNISLNKLPKLFAEIYFQKSTNKFKYFNIFNLQFQYNFIMLNLKALTSKFKALSDSILFITTHKRKKIKMKKQKFWKKWKVRKTAQLRKK